MAKLKVTRRRFLQTTAAASTFIAAPFVRDANAAGSLSIGFWDHWVPGANKATEEIVRAWADKEKVDVKMDFITSQGNKNLLTIAAEGQAKAGHDIFAFPTWWPQQHADSLEPVNDLMTELIKQNGNVNGTVEYLGRDKDRWLDVQAMYPAGSAPKAENWTLDTFLKAAEACHKAGSTFGIGLGQTLAEPDAE